MSKSLLKKRFSVKDRGSNETLGRIEADFLMHPTRRFDFGLRWTLFKQAKLVSRSARSHSWLCPFKDENVRENFWNLEAFYWNIFVQLGENFGEKQIQQKDIPARHKHPVFNCNKSSQKNFWKMTVHLPLPMPKAIVRKKVRVVVVFVAVGLFVCLFIYLLPGGLIITGFATYLERCFPVWQACRDCKFELRKSLIFTASFHTFFQNRPFMLGVVASCT